MSKMKFTEQTQGCQSIQYMFSVPVQLYVKGVLILKQVHIPAGLLSSHSFPNKGFGKERNPRAPLSKINNTGSPTLKCSN